MEDKQDLTEQQQMLLSKLETLRAEMHRSVDARVDRSIQRILTGSVLEESPTLPLHTDPSVFKGKKPEAVLFPNGQSVRTPTWKAAVLAIMQDCNADPTMHTYLMELRGKVSFLGTGRATYFIGTYGNRNNRLQPYDCATKMAYDYSKVGDKNVQIRNLDTDEVFTYYQADVGALPDAIIDIWGEDNIRELAGTPDGAPTDNANNVRYYHERFSDQTAPAR